MLKTKVMSKTEHFLLYYILLSLRFLFLVGGDGVPSVLLSTSPQPCIQ